MKKLKKFSVIFLLFLFVTCGSLSIAYANGSIEDLMELWFKDKTAQSIGRIEENITSEKVKQTNRLKDELELHFSNLEEELERFVEVESEKRIVAIQAYANQKIAVIADMENNEQKKKEIEAELNAIYQAAVQAIEAVAN